MADPGSILPDQYEILATRMLRAAGLPIDHPRVLEQTSGEEQTSDYVLVLTTRWRNAAGDERVLIACCRNSEPIGIPQLDAFADRRREDTIVVFATGDYVPVAHQHAAERGIALYRVLDAKAAYQGWGFAGQIPSWLPEFTAERAGGATLSD